MNDEYRKSSTAFPSDEPHSHLEPYRELILRWPRQGRSYRRIRELLADKCSMSCLMTHSMALCEDGRARARYQAAEPAAETESRYNREAFEQRTPETLGRTARRQTTVQARTLPGILFCAGAGRGEAIGGFSKSYMTNARSKLRMSRCAGLFQRRSRPARYSQNFSRNRPR